MGFFNELGKFFVGSPEVRENVSTLRKEQEPLFQQLIRSGIGRGAGGAFGSASDYYRGLLGDEDFDQFSAPMMRQYQQDIVPSLSEQFAGMGSGGLSSSGFRNAQIQGATDLSERLAQLRAGLRQSGAEGLMRIGQQGLQPYTQNMVTQPGSEGFLSSVAPAAGTAIGSFLGPLGAAAGNQLGAWFSGGSRSGNKIGANSAPYGQNGPMASPSALPNQGFQRMQLPTFAQGYR